MTTKEVLDSVLNYINLPGTDYAVLINGPWGCGKTYFWKNIIEPSLRKGGKTLPTPLYASFYGCENLRDVDIQLLVSHPKIKKKWEKKFSKIGINVIKQLIKKFTSLDVSQIINPRFLVKTKNVLLCFDDLERGNLPMEEILGYINTFVEHEGLKVVLICNEDGIAKEESKEIYKKMKEKIVGRLLTFQPEIETIFDIFADEYKTQEEFYKFLKKNTQLILHLFKSSETNNLRVLRRFLTILFAVFEILSEKGVHPDKLAEQLIYAAAPTAFELYGRAEEPEKLKSIHAHDFLPTGLLIGKDAEKTYEKQFRDRYFRQHSLLDMAKIVGCPPVCDYMITGYLNQDLLLEWAQKLIEAPDERKEQAKRLISNDLKMEDQEFKNEALQVIGYVESGDFTEIGEYVALYKCFEYYADKNLIPFTTKEVLEKFKRGLQNAQKTDKLTPDSHLESEFKHLSLKEANDESKTFLEFAKELNKQMLERQQAKKVEESLSHLADNPEAFIAALAGGGGSRSHLVPIFHQVDINEITKKILSLPNHSKMAFANALSERYLPLRSGYPEELPNLTKMREIFKYHCEQAGRDSTTPISLFCIQQIVDILDKAIVQLRQNSDNSNLST
jgi:hypothetical protein